MSLQDTFIGSKITVCILLLQSFEKPTTDIVRFSNLKARTIRVLLQWIIEQKKTPWNRKTAITVGRFPNVLYEYMVAPLLCIKPWRIAKNIKTSPQPIIIENGIYLPEVTKHLNRSTTIWSTLNLKNFNDNSDRFKNQSSQINNTQTENREEIMH